MCVYDDVNGWQHKQFLGQGEFTLTFGNYKVALTVPNDHIVGATGELQNAAQVLTAEQQKRMEKAKTAAHPVLIVSQEEAEKAEKAEKEKSKFENLYNNMKKENAGYSIRIYSRKNTSLTLCYKYYA